LILLASNITSSRRKKMDFSAQEKIDNVERKNSLTSTTSVSPTLINEQSNLSEILEINVNKDVEDIRKIKVGQSSSDRIVIALNQDSVKE